MLELDLKTALAIAEASRARAKELAINISIAVVDRSGRTIVLQRGDNLGFVTTDFALGKAVAAAGFRRDTMLLQEMWDEYNAFLTSALHASSSPMVFGTGAVPVYSGDRIMGGIGCAGATPEQDRVCALAGADVVSRMKVGVEI